MKNKILLFSFILLRFLTLFFPQLFIGIGLVAGSFYVIFLHSINDKNKQLEIVAKIISYFYYVAIILILVFFGYEAREGYVRNKNLILQNQYNDYYSNISQNAINMFYELESSGAIDMRYDNYAPKFYETFDEEGHFEGLKKESNKVYPIILKNYCLTKEIVKQKEIFIKDNGNFDIINVKDKYNVNSYVIGLKYILSILKTQKNLEEGYLFDTNELYTDKLSNSKKVYILGLHLKKIFGNKNNFVYDQFLEKYMNIFILYVDSTAYSLENLVYPKERTQENFDGDCDNIFSGGRRNP